MSEQLQSQNSQMQEADALGIHRAASEALQQAATDYVSVDEAQHWNPGEGFLRHSNLEQNLNAITGGRHGVAGIETRVTSDAALENGSVRYKASLYTESDLKEVLTGSERHDRHSGEVDVARKVNGQEYKSTIRGKAGQRAAEILIKRAARVAQEKSAKETKPAA